MKISIQPSYRLTVLLVTLFFCAVSLPSTALTFEAASDNYQSGKLQLARAQFTELAKDGDAEAQFNLGVMFYQGEGGEKSLREAYAWMSLANEEPIEQWSAIVEKVRSKLGEVQLTEANQLADDYLSRYGADAQRERSQPDFSGPFSVIPEKEFIDYESPNYRHRGYNAVKRGWTLVEYEVDEFGYVRNPQVVDSMPGRYFETEAISAAKKWRVEPLLDDSGNPVARRGNRFRLTFAGSTGSAFMASLREELHAQHLEGKPLATYLYGLLGARTSNTADPDENPNHYILKAAEAGVPIAQYRLGVNLLEGRNVRQDREKGVRWLKKAARAGNHYASIELVHHYLEAANDLDSAKFWVEYATQSEQDEIQIAAGCAMISDAMGSHRNPRRTIQILSQQTRALHDKISVYSCLAAAYHAQGSFKSALKYQRKAIDEASHYRHEKRKAIFQRTLDAWKAQEGGQ